MLPDDESRIRRRAYEIWEREGRPEGREADHWRLAAAEIEGERRAETQAVPAARVTETAPTAAELAERDPTGRASISEEQERAEQRAVATEADPLGAVTGSGPEPSAAAGSGDAEAPPASKRRAAGKGRSSRAKKPPVPSSS